MSRRRSLGLNKRWKTFGLVLVAVLFCIAEAHWGGVHTTLSFTRYDLPGAELGTVGWVIWGTVIIFGTANSVNLTDGLDGLAAGSAAFVCGFLALVGFVQYRHPGIYRVHSALDLALVAMSMGGACVGFLWWNAAPARIIMGDTGSLSIGTGLACLALVDERAAASADHRRPVRHRDHVGRDPGDQLQGLSPACVPDGAAAPPFRARGWPETTVTVRFWIFSGLCVALGVGLFYADFLSAGSLK